MVNCENLCTAAKCEELELRILELEGWLNALEGRLINLEVGLDEHITKVASEAHSWDVSLDISSFFYDEDYNDLNLTIELYSATTGEVFTNPYVYTDELPFALQVDLDDHIEMAIPDAHEYMPEVLVEIIPADSPPDVFPPDFDPGLDPGFGLGNLIRVTVDDSFGEAPLEVGGGGFVVEELGLVITENPTTSGEFVIEVSLGEQVVQDTLVVNTSALFSDLDFFFRIDDLSNNDWNFVITIGDRTRSQILNLPSFSGGGSGGGSGGDSGDNATEEELPPANLSLNGSYDIANNDINIIVAVNGKSASTTINLDAMPFDNIQNSLDEILNSLNIELSGQYEVGKTDTTLLDANGDKIIDYSRYIPLTNGQEGYVETSYTDNGLAGLHQAIIALDKKITTVHKDLAKAVDPQISLEVIAPTNCYENVSRSDYTDEEWELLPQEIKDEIEKDFDDKFRDFVLGNPVLSELFEPLLRTVGTLAFKLTNIPAFFALNFASNFLIHQLKDDHPIDCSYIKTLPTETEIETVTIVASPEVQANIKDDVLVLDFTTVEAFPELNEIRNKWRIQIPAPIENITWDAVKDIRWFRGGLYGQLKFVGRKNTTSGWFRSKADGESYFNQIAALTTLEIENISFSEHSNPKVSPAERLTRVHRAFKVFVSENGEPNNELTQVFKPPLGAE